jgi:hypothetical protein
MVCHQTPAPRILFPLERILAIVTNGQQLLKAQMRLNDSKSNREGYMAEV